MSESDRADEQPTGRLALDSMPATLKHPEWADHTAMQLAALVLRPLTVPGPAGLPAPYGASDVSSSADGRLHEFAVRAGPRWSDGTLLKAQDYAAAFDRAARSRSAAGYWLRDVDTVRADGDRLVVRTRRPDHGLPGLAAVPALCPYRGPRDGVGRYRLATESQHRLVLDRVPGGTGLRRLCLHRLKDPVRNLAAYADRRIDVTADTAFPLGRAAAMLAGAPEMRRLRIGVLVVLCFEGHLVTPSALDTRRAIVDVLDQHDVRSRLPSGLLPLQRWRPDENFDAALASAVSVRSRSRRAVAVPSGAPRYRLAYDTYYPNRSVAAAVAASLSRGGIGVDLVADRYESRGHHAELRVNLVRALRPDPLGLHRGLLFLPTTRNDAVVEEFVGVLNSHDVRPPDASDAPGTADVLEAYVRERALAVPLAEMPGLFLSRLGPDPWGWRHAVER